MIPKDASISNDFRSFVLVIFNLILSCYIKPNLDCNYTFPINLASNAIPFGANQSDKCNYNPNLLLFNYIENSSCTVIKEQPIPSY